MKTVLLLPLIFLSSLAYSAELVVNPDEIKDYSEKSGVGCTQSSPDKDKVIHIVCKSKISADSAWNASMYRAKFACESQLFDMLFRKPPSLPEVNGVFGTQMEIRCKERP